ncbi:MAG TPA: AAA family ATPase [Gemmatimonadaceae bacterium]|nr:AAA family ATPase [Gemmatimonadaceae bacterium]
MMRLRLLGQSTIEIGSSVLTPAAETLFAAALYLAFELRPVRRRDLARLLWPEAHEHRAQHCLRQALYRLKTMGVAFRSDRTGIMLAPKSVASDVAPILWTPEGADLVELADRIEGRFLPGYAPRFSAAFAEWVEQKRDVVHSALRRVLVGAIATRRRRGEWRGAELLAERCLAIDPLNEEATFAIAESAAMLGSKIQAVSILDRYLREIGPDAREIRVPAALLRRRIAEAYDSEPLPMRQVPLIGREEEMAELMRALQLSGDGQGSAYLVWGEPGIGKTRLVTEFTRLAALQRVQVAKVGCQSHDERRPMSAFVDLVPKLLELPGAIGCSPETMKYLKRLIAHDPTETTLSPDSRDAELLFANVRRSFFDLLDAIAGESRLIVVIEDVHWLDRMSWELLWGMMGWIITRQIVLVLTSRQGLGANLPANPDAPRPIALSLKPLQDRARRELLRELVRGTGREEDTDFLTWCINSSGGSPYYLAELAANARREGDCFQPPASLNRLINDRLARLSPLAKRVLQACSLLGRLSTSDRIERMLGERRLSLLSAFEELEHLGLIESDGATVLCRHELLATAATQHLSPLGRQLLHRHAAEVLEQDTTTEQSPTLVWECVEHLERAGDRDRAVGFVLGCARHLIGLGLPNAAIELYDRLLAYDTGRLHTPSLLEERIIALQLADQWEQLSAALQHLWRVQEQVGIVAERHSTFELLSIEARWQLGQPIDRSYDQLLECVHDGSASRDHRLHAALLALIFADNLYRRDGVHEVAATAETLSSWPGKDSLIALQTLRLIYLTSFGDLASAAGAAEALQDSVRNCGNPAQVSRSLRHASLALEAAGLRDRATESAREALQIAEAEGMTNAVIAAASRLVTLSLARGDGTEASFWLTKAEEIALRRASTLNDSSMSLTRARIALDRGDIDGAARHIDRLREPDQLVDTPRARTQVLALETDLMLQSGSWNPTKSQLDELYNVFVRCRSFVGHDYATAVLVEAFAASGLRAEAQGMLCGYLQEWRREKSSLLPRLANLREMLL